jgi:hypothetical protein
MAKLCGKSETVTKISDCTVPVWVSLTIFDQNNHCNQRYLNTGTGTLVPVAYLPTKFTHVNLLCRDAPDIRPDNPAFMISEIRPDTGSDWPNTG